VKASRVLLLFSFLLTAHFKHVMSADMLVDLTKTYTIPDDGNTWYLESSYSLTDDFFVDGIFEIRSTGTLKIDETTINGVDDGGAAGSNIEIRIEPTGDLRVKNNGTLLLKSGNGGTGGGAGSPGGNGGAITLVSIGDFFVEEGGFFTLEGGAGGVGGAASAHYTTGAVGGSGGTIVVYHFSEVVFNSGAIPQFVGGAGGDGGASALLARNGGSGGGGGKIVLQGDSNVYVGESVLLEIYGGAGGDGESGIGVPEPPTDSAYGGNGGTGGAVEISSADLIITFSSGSFLSTQSGSNGSAGSGNPTYAGSGGAGGVTKLIYGKIVLLDDARVITSVGSGGPSLLYNFTIEDFGAFSYTDPRITLTQQLDINFTWVIDSNKKIYGNGNKIILGASGEIVVNSGVSLLLDNLEVEGVSSTNVRCLGATSLISLQNADFVLSNNYTFGTGQISVNGTCNIDGSGKTFLFQSANALTIQTGSSFQFTPNTIFSYDSSSNNLLQMSDASSILFLDNATLLATQALSLSTGVLSTDGRVTLQGIGRLSLSGLSDIIVRNAILRSGDVVL
jgi:hypothetical protein